MPGKHSKMPQNLDADESEGFSEGMSEGSSVNISDFRDYLDKINIRIGPREQRTLFRYCKKEFFKEKELSDEEVFPLLKKFLMHPAGPRNIENIRKDCMRTANLWTLDKLCGIEIKGDRVDDLPNDSAVKQELDRLQRCAARLPTDVSDKDIRKRDWMFQRYDIGKTGRLVMAAVDNMIHILFGELAYDVKDVVRAAFRATKNVAIDSGSAAPGTHNQIERDEFRLLLLALKSHIELFIAFRMVDSSRDMKIDFDEFKKSLPMLKRWGVDVSDPHALFDIIDADHSGEITFAEFVNWSLKEAIIADLEYRERMSHNVELGDTVLLTGEFQGIVGKVVSYDRATKTYVIELPDGTRINRKPTDFVNGAATEEILPGLPVGNTNKYSKWFESLLKDMMPGTDHPWITEEPIYIKSEWSNRPKEYHFEIRCVFGGDDLVGESWAKSFKEGKNMAAKQLRTKIEKHPAVLKAMQYVNQETAKEKEAEAARMNSLKQEQTAEQGAMESYRMELWKRDMIGKPTLGADAFFKVMQDCNAKISQREAKLIHRNCSKGNAEATFVDINEFFENAKRLDRKLQSVRDNAKKSWKKKRWDAFVARSNPDDAEENLKKWDEEHEKPMVHEVEELEKQLEEELEEDLKMNADQIESANEHAKEIKEQASEMLSHLEHFLEETEDNTKTEDSEEEVKAAPQPQVKGKGKKKGGLLVIKSTAKKGNVQAKKEKKKNIVRSRPASGKRKA